MKLLKVLALRGPNLWANFPVLEAWVDLEELKESPSNTIPGLNERLKAWLPTMIEHRCSIGERGGFFRRLDDGTYPAHILEHVTLELQTLAGCEVGFGRARETATDGVYKVAIEYTDEPFARAALDAGLELYLSAVYDRPFDVAATVARLRALYHQVTLGPSTRAIVRAAAARGIPWRRLNDGSLVQLGWGARQRRILAAATDQTSAVAEEIAQDKQLTRQLLRAAGIPTPRGYPVATALEAWETAQDLGLPVVVKPQFGNQGRGVAVNLTTREQVLAAFEAARRESSYLMVEKHIVGADYRLLVVNGRLVAAARREPAQVVGDGLHTVRQLVDRENRNPLRGDDHATPLSKLVLNDLALAVLDEQGFEPDDVPPEGLAVLIRRNANLSTGGTAIDVTDDVHPETAARAVEAARIIGLDIAGIDVVCQDLRRPLDEQGGAVVEVNARPGLRMHLEPSAGQGRPVGEAIVDALFPPGHNGRVPLVAVTGVNGKTTTTRLVAHILRTWGKRVGMTSTDGIFLDGRRVDDGDCSGPQSARAVLSNPHVEAAVLETARGGILREGLAFDRCDVAVVTNIGEGDHLGLSDVNTLEQLAKVKRCIVDVVAPDGTAVLKADDPLVAAMAEKCPGSVTFFCRDESHPVLRQHREAGGRAAFVRDHALVLADGAHEFALLSLLRIPLTHAGRIAFQVENVLAAAAAAWRVGVPAEVIRAGLESFAADMGGSPARFNVMEINGATVVVDYGHNPSALEAVLEALQPFPAARRGVVYSAAGDRRDQDMIRQGELLGAFFDRCWLYEDSYKRGRADGEIIALFRQGLTRGGRVADVAEFDGALKAVEAALESAQPGDLLLVQADRVDETVEFIKQYTEARALGQHGTPPAPALSAAKPERTAPLVD